MRYYYGMDWTYIFVLIGALVSFIASINVKSTFKKCSKIKNREGLTANDVAAKILKITGCYDVHIEKVNGSLTDHYAPTEKVLRLSDSVYGQDSVAAIGVAAHECGHAVQHNEGYFPVKLRSLSVPIANFGSKLSWPIILLGVILSFQPLIQIGVLAFTFVVLFQVITLPVEFDASKRALRILTENNILEEDEVAVARKVLKAAALTYVASLFTAIMQLLRFILISRGAGSRRRR